MWKLLLLVFALLRGKNNSASAHDISALHHIYEVAPGEEILISLRGHDLYGDKTPATITKLPRLGVLYQLSHVFNNHGYDPKKGTPINTAPTVITGKYSRVVYLRPSFDYYAHYISSDSYKQRDADEFEYTVNDGEHNNDDGDGLAGKVTVVSDTTRQLVSSEFRFLDEGWTTVGNKRSHVKHESTRRGDMSNYIYAVDDLIDVDAKGNDRQIWNFLLPEKYTGWYGSGYGGTFEFSLSSFSGDYSGANAHWADDKFHPLNLVEIYCQYCDLFKGATVAFPLSNTQGFTGRTTKYSLDMTETAGWMKDPQNTLFEWTTPSKCNFIEILSGITSVKILGDFTNWYESVSIDNVKWVAAPSGGRYQLPICAKDAGDESPDAPPLDESNFPKWSWDHVHSYVAIRRNDRYTDKEIREIANHDVVMLEKQNGMTTYGSVEEGTLEAARRIKHANPRVKILFYLNAMLHYPFYEANKTFKAEEWAIRKGENNALFKFGNKYFYYDHSNLEFREWWIQRAIKMLDNENIDGIFIDAIVKTTKNVPEGNGELYIETANELRDRLPPGKLLVGNALRNIETGEPGGDGNVNHLKYLDGSYLERWDFSPTDIVKSMELMSAALKEGKIIMLNAQPTCGYPLSKKRELEKGIDPMSLEERYDYLETKIGLPLAIFLLIVEPYAYISYHYGVDARNKAAFDCNRFNELKSKLGEAKGPYVKEGEFSFSREFEYIKVWVNLETKEYKFETYGSERLLEKDEL